MQRFVLRKVSPLHALNGNVLRGHVQNRFLATVNDVFPHKTDFPSRHIGPRKTDVVAMLDSLGFKVRLAVVFFS